MKLADNVIVLGGSHHNTLGVIRALGRMGVRSDIIICDEDSDSFVAKSSYVASCKYVRCEEQALMFLQQQDAGSEKKVVISCSDRFSAFLDSHKRELEGHYFVPGSDSKEGLLYWMNKDNMALAAIECGLNVPQAGTEQFPIMAKPLASINGGKNGICVIWNKNELSEYKTKYSEEQVQFQKFIDKEFEYQLIGCSMGAGKNICIPGVSKIIRQPSNTNTGFLKYEPLDGSYPIEKCRMFLERIGYSGLFSMEFLRGKDGRDYFMEINLRNDGNAICVTDAGVNLPYIWYEYCINNIVPEFHEIHPLYCMPEVDDFKQSVLKRRISLLQWVKDVRKTDSFMEYAKDDRKPFYARIKHELRCIIKKAYKSLINWRWEIGFVENTLEGIVKGEPLKVNWVKLLFKDRWFADPFILEVTDDEIIVLGEEYADEVRRGRIAKIVIDRRTYQLKSWKIILDLPTHLSFPAIVRREGRIFIYPENSESGKLTIYEYDPETEQVKPLHILSDEPLTDAVYSEAFDGRKILFSTQLPHSNTNTLDISEWDESQQRFVKIGVVVSNEKTGRMAGDVFTVNGKIYRPAQESNIEYGHAIDIQEMVYCNGKWSLIPVRRMESPHPVLKLGFHTFNTYKGHIVIDVKGFRRPVIGKTLKFLKNLLKH